MSVPRYPEKLDHGVSPVVHLNEEHAMSIHIEIPEPLAEKVAPAAKSQGISPADVVLEAVAKRVDPFARLHELMAPVYDRMQELGITEDEAVEDFERKSTLCGGSVGPPKNDQARACRL